MSELRMLAEWSVDIGADSPWLVIPWEGWVDLRNPGVDSLSRSAENSKVPAPIAQLTEVVDYPEVASLLQLGNQPGTLTSKIDVFPSLPMKLIRRLPNMAPLQLPSGWPAISMY
jgi:hypothetical protein